MYKKGRVNSNSRIISTDEDPSLRIESSAIINLRGVSTKLNKYKPCLDQNPDFIEEGIPDLFPSCVVTCAMATAKDYSSENDKHADETDLADSCLAQFIENYKFAVPSESDLFTNEKVHSNRFRNLILLPSNTKTQKNFDTV